MGSTMTSNVGSLNKDAEIFYGFDELFFSYTDPRGIIQSGNEVFKRVSQYAWDELLGAPHKIIRHPDMPRAVFWLLWDTLKRGQPIGAYVKNRAKDGSYYWVFAVVTPVPEGYLSVRLRPSSELFAAVRPEYVDLAGRERQERLAPAESAALLLKRLAELGFRNYETFMATALGHEMAARDAAMRRAPNAFIQYFLQLQQTAQELLKQADLIQRAYQDNEVVPLNFRVLASQLGQDGAAFGVLSVNYSTLAATMQTALEQFIALAQKVWEAVSASFFLSCTGQLQRDMLALFDRELATTRFARDAERRLLASQQEEYAAKSSQSLQGIRHQAREFQDSCYEMKRLSASLEIMRIMGKMECSRQIETGGKLNHLLGELGSFQRTATAALNALDRTNNDIQSSAAQLMAIA